MKVDPKDTVVLRTRYKDPEHPFLSIPFDSFIASIVALCRMARLQFATWNRAHQALASGVKQPAKWMELSVQAVKAAL